MTHKDLIDQSYDYPIIAIDGQCILCNRTILWILKKDIHKTFRYTHLQKLDTSTTDNRMDSVLLYHNAQVFSHTDAVLQILTLLPYPYKYFRFLRCIPAVVRDWIYRYIAANRYRWFGKKDYCIIPNAETQDLLIS